MSKESVDDAVEDLEKKTRSAAKKEHISKRFSKAHGFKKEEVDEVIKSNPNNFNKKLDRMAFSNITNPIRFKEELTDKLTSTNMRNLGGMIPRIGIPGTSASVPLGKTLSNGLHIGMKSDVDRFAKMVETDYNKKLGVSLNGRGVTSGFSATRAEVANASRGVRASNFLSHMNPFGASARESVMTSMGFTGRDSRILAAKGNMMESFSRRALAPAFGIMMAADAMNSDTPLASYATGIAVGTGLQQGWRAGKAGASIISTAHKARLAGGAIGAGIMAAIPAAAIMGQADLLNNDSFVAKQAKKAYTRETYAMGRETQTSLTMRQAGLEKLSSSYLNNRQQLLGNEAAILKNAQL